MARRGETAVLIYGAVLLTAALLLYAETSAFAWDEGFHLLAAQLIRQGRRPYLDFFFPQTPLNTYWNALWMLVFGDTWRVAHAVGAICTGVSALLLAQYIQARFGTALALCSLVTFGLNELVVRFGGIGQAYGFCLLMLVCAFRCSLPAGERNGIWWSAGTGFFASAAAAASLLTVPALPVFLLWLAFYTRSVRKIAACAAAAVVPFLPLIVLLAQAPRVVFFQAFEYNARYRTVLWEDNSAVTNNLAVYGSLLRSPAALVLVGLSIYALLRLRRSPDAVLCMGLAASMSIYIAAPFPTFARYFVFVMPFLAVLSMSVIHQFAPKARIAAAAMLCLATVLSLGQTLYRERQSYGWDKMEEIARQVDQVTPAGAPVLADEQIYFLTRRVPPSGLEHENSHKPLPLSPEFRSALHIIPQQELDRLTRSGAFATVASCDDKDTVNDLGLPKTYRHHADAGECTVYWSRIAPVITPSPDKGPSRLPR